MTLAAAHPSARLLPAVWKLLILRLRININSFRHARRRVKFFTILGIIGLITLAGFIFWGSWMLLGFLQSPRLARAVGVNVLPFLDSVPVVILSVMFLGILLTSFGVLLQALYLSGDLDFLLAAPVPIRAVFIAKLLQAVLPNFTLLAIFGLPIIYGLGASRGYNLLYYPLVLLTMFSLTLAAAGLSSLLVMLIVRIFPARRVAEVLGFVGATVSILCSQTGNLLPFSRQAADGSRGQLGSFFDLVVRLNNPWLPLNWAGRGLVELGQDNLLVGLVLVALTVGLFAAAFWFALLTAERWYYTGWAGMQVVARKKRPAPGQRPGAASLTAAFSLGLERILPAPVRGIVQKDFLVLRRDLRNLSQLVTPLIFGIIYALAFLRTGNSPSEGRGELSAWFMQTFGPVMAYGNIGIALFVGWTLLTRLGSMAFSQEGKNYWLLKVSPVSARHMLDAKFLVAFLPTFALSGIFLTAISVLQGFVLANYLFSLVVMGFCLAGMSGILVGFGAAGANFEWDDPSKMNSGVVGCVGMALTALFLPVAFAFFFGPVLLAPMIQFPEYYGYLGGLALGGSFSGFSAFLPLWLAHRKVEHLGEA